MHAAEPLTILAAAIATPARLVAAFDRKADWLAALQRACRHELQRVNGRQRCRTAGYGAKCPHEEGCPLPPDFGGSKEGRLRRQMQCVRLQALRGKRNARIKEFSAVRAAIAKVQRGAHVRIRL